MTYLHYFAKREDESICSLLLRYGADPYKKCSNSRRSYDTEVAGPTPIELWPLMMPNIVQRETTAIRRLGAVALKHKKYDIFFTFKL
jgi:hypothetical protein